MAVEIRFEHLAPRHDKRTQELFVQSAGVRASTIWHDRYISHLRPEQIADDRDLPLAAVYEALAYCQEHWEIISREKDRERQWLEQRGFFKV